MPSSPTASEVIDQPHPMMRSFLERIQGDLASNHMLRGAWIEEVVASYLAIDVFPGALNYFDLRTQDGYSVSIKQSIGDRARFDISGRQWAWDNELAEKLREVDPRAEGWLENESGARRRWCDLWVFAHLPGEPELGRIADPAEWRFAAVSCTWLDALSGSPKSLTPKRIENEGVSFVAGEELADSVQQAGQCLDNPVTWHPVASTGTF